jgi:glycosyltransferase involved in cell wall biosynthesis
LVAEGTPREDVEFAVSGNGLDWARSLTAPGGTASLDLALDPAVGITVYAYQGDSPVAVCGGFPALPALRRAREGGASVDPAPGFAIAPINDKHWKNGFLRRARANEEYAVLCRRPADDPEPGIGDILRLPSGQMRRISSVKVKTDITDLGFRQPVNPTRDGAPGAIHIIRRQTDIARVAAPDRSWKGNIWRGDGPFSGYYALIPTRVLRDGRTANHRSEAGLALQTGDGAVHEITAIFHAGEDALVHLATPLGSHVGDTRGLRCITSPTALGLALCRVDAPGWRNGIAAEDDCPGHRFLLPARTLIRAGDVLAFPEAGVRVVTAVRPVTLPDGAAYCEAALDMAIDPDRDGACTVPLRLATADEIIGRGSGDLLWPSPVKAPSPGSLAIAIDELRASPGELHRIPAARDATRPRVLFASLVPPIPADQGNRIVTRNFIRHLVNQGFDVDLLLVGDLPVDQLHDDFGDRVRLFSWPYPAWNEAPEARLRLGLMQQLIEQGKEALDSGSFSRLQTEIATYHPYFIVPDELIRLARQLFRRVEYHSIVCNYTHMIRVALELEPIRKLPPVTVITHDALSRLPFSFEEHVFDTGHRYCRPEMERDVLNAVDGAVILAISESERSYFQEIGVRNPIVLCEYDGRREGMRHQISPRAFERKRLIFHASSNPMNIASLVYFLQNCWDEIRRAVPEAQLVICGKVGSAVPHPGAGVSVLGVIPRQDLVTELSRASVAINPTVAGTGLKIKTVEAACFGIPSVCLPAAVEGLEHVAGEFGILARSAQEFSEGCIRLLQDRDLWLEKHESALRFATERFSEAAIYGEVDARMEWSEDVGARFDQPREPYAPVLARRLPKDIVAPDPGTLEKWHLAFGLLDLGESPALIWPLIERILGQIGPDQTDLASYLVQIGFGVEGAEAAINELLLRLLAADPANPVLLQLLCMSSALMKNESLIRQTRKLLLEVAPNWTCCPPRDDRPPQLEKAMSRPDCRVIDIPVGADFTLPGRLGGDPIAGKGWSRAEDWGVWTQNQHSVLTLRCGLADTDVAVKMQMRAVESDVLGDQYLRLFVNGRHIGAHAIPRGQALTWVELGDVRTDENGLLQIDMYSSDLLSVHGPDGEVRDARTLGIALQTLNVSAVSKREGSQKRDAGPTDPGDEDEEHSD